MDRGVATCTGVSATWQLHLLVLSATMRRTTMAVCSNLLALSVVFVLMAQSASSTVTDVSGFYADNGLQVCMLDNVLNKICWPVLWPDWNCLRILKQKKMMRHSVMKKVALKVVYIYMYVNY